MKIVFAQGNPDMKYKKTRHNAGFLTLDAFAETQSAVWRDIDKHRGRISTVVIDGEKVLLVKPLSYYNDTGIVARTLIDYYKLDPVKDFLVIHDDLALPFGTIRIRDKGSDAGNNGIKSLNEHLGPSYARIRIGIWNDLRDRMDDADFVLSNFSKSETKTLEKSVYPHVISLIEDFLNEKLTLSSATIDT